MSYTNNKKISKSIKDNNSFLFIDIETNGMIKDKNSKNKQYRQEKKFPSYESVEYDNCRLVQVSYVLLESDELKKINFDIDYDFEDYVIYPNKFKIKNDHIHGITYKYARKNGIKFKDFVKKFRSILKKTNYIVGYNPYFDINVLLSELYRYNKKITLERLNKFVKNKNIFCVGELCSKNNIPSYWNKYYKYQIPKLVDSYKAIFNNEYNNAHNSKFDVKATIDIFKHILNKNKKKKKKNINLKILSYNLFFGSSEKQIEYIKDNKFDVMFLTECDRNISNKLDNYHFILKKSHCGYTGLCILKKYYENSEIFKSIIIDGNIFAIMIYNNIPIILGSLHFAPSKNNSDVRLETVNNILDFLSEFKEKCIIIFGGDTNMCEKNEDDRKAIKKLLDYDDVDSELKLSTYPNKEFKHEKLKFIPNTTKRYDRIFLKNCVCDSFIVNEDINDSDHHSLESVIRIKNLTKTNNFNEIINKFNDFVDDNSKDSDETENYDSDDSDNYLIHYFHDIPKLSDEFLYARVKNSDDYEKIKIYNGIRADLYDDSGSHFFETDFSLCGYGKPYAISQLYPCNHCKIIYLVESCSGRDYNGDFDNSITGCYNCKKCKRDIELFFSTNM